MATNFMKTDDYYDDDEQPLSWRIRDYYEQPLSGRTEEGPPLSGRREEEPPLSARTEEEPPLSARTEEEPPLSGRTEPLSARTEEEPSLSEMNEIAIKETYMQTFCRYLVNASRNARRFFSCRRGGRMQSRRKFKKKPCTMKKKHKKWRHLLIVVFDERSDVPYGLFVKRAVGVLFAVNDFCSGCVGGSGCGMVIEQCIQLSGGDRRAEAGHDCGGHGDHDGEHVAALFVQFVCVSEVGQQHGQSHHYIGHVGAIKEVCGDVRRRLSSDSVTTEKVLEQRRQCSQHSEIRHREAQNEEVYVHSVSHVLGRGRRVAKSTAGVESQAKTVAVAGLPTVGDVEGAVAADGGVEKQFEEHQKYHECDASA